MKKLAPFFALLLIVYILVVAVMVAGIAHTEYKLWCADIDNVPGIIAEWDGNKCNLLGDQKEIIDWGEY